MTKKLDTKFLKLLVDFDGVLQESYDWHGTYVFTRPVDGGLSWVQWVYNTGCQLFGYDYCQLVVFTARPDIAAVQGWLAVNGFAPYIDHVTNVKEWAHLYIDDKGLRFVNFNQLKRAMSEVLNGS